MLKKKIVKGILGITTAVMLLGGDPVSPVLESVGVVQEVEAASTKLNKKNFILKAKEKQTAVLNGVSSKNQKKVKWSSNSKKLIVTANKKDGRKATFYSKDVGNYKVTARYNGKSYVCSVRVENINKTKLTLKKGQKYTLKLSNTKGKAVWKASNKNVGMKVSSNRKSAVVTGKKAGKSTISVKVDGKKYVCSIKVKGNSSSRPSVTPTPTSKPSRPVPTVSPSRVSSIVFSEEKLTFFEKEARGSITAHLHPSDATDRDVVWESSDCSVAKVDQKGRVTAVGNGRATVRCYLKSDRSVYASCPVVVCFPESISLSSESLSLEVGGSSKLEARVNPSNGETYQFMWESSDSSVCMVDENGNVSAKGSGSAVVRCSLANDTSIYSECRVTVKSKENNTPSTKYTYSISTDLKYTTTFNGGDLIGFNIFTNAPFDKINIAVSNSILRYNNVFINDKNYDFGFYAIKKGTCKVSIYLDGVLMNSWNVIVTSDDQNWIKYESWWNGMIQDMGSSWTDVNPLQKIINVGQYLLDHYDYDYDANSAFHINGCGNCNASSFVLKDTAQRLGLKAEVVTPEAWVEINPSHVVARVYVDGNIYDIEAGFSGKAGERGTVAVSKMN